MMALLLLLMTMMALTPLMALLTLMLLAMTKMLLIPKTTYPSRPCSRRLFRNRRLHENL
jgi:hypothetical protein